jgi:hypothetical protein
MTNTTECIKYFKSKYNEISEISRVLCNKKKNEEITDELFNISKELLDFLNNKENLINPPGNIILVDEFRIFLINCISKYDSLYIHSPLSFSTEKGKDSFNYTAPEIIRESYFQLISVYIWCKHFTDQGYSGVLPEMIFD